METVDEAVEDADMDASTGDDIGVAPSDENLEPEGGNLNSSNESVRDFCY